MRVSLKEPMLQALPQLGKNALGQECRLPLLRCVLACSMKRHYPYPKYLSTKVAVVNIDCDIYGLAVDALAAIGNRLQVGCVLMFDDYIAYSAVNRKGVRLAFPEFFDSVPFKFEPWFANQYSGQSFLCVED